VVRNPLADPALVGISGGAALGAVGAFVLGAPLLAHPEVGRWVVPAAAFAGALLATRLALVLARVDGRTSGVTLLLAGVGLAALTGAGTGLALYLADDAALRSITFWSLGSIGGASWEVVGVVAVPVAVALIGLPRLAGDLDRLALGEAEARHVGVEVERVIRAVIAVAALAVGAAVATCGVIGFVGLVVPYLARVAVGPGHRALIPACALGGATLLVAADLAARTVVAPAELPVGIVTALAGAPVLLVLVRRGRGAEVLP
jgi:iron complex transport system permease protein